MPQKDKNRQGDEPEEFEEEESRIVHGDGLPENGTQLDSIIVDAAPQHTKPAASQSLANAPYKLKEYLVWMLSHAYVRFGQRELANLLKDGGVHSAVDTLGPEVFTLKNLRWETHHEVIDGTKLGVGKHEFDHIYVAADLSLTDKFPPENFKKLLVNLYGQEKYDFIVSSDLGKNLGLNDPTKPVDISSEQISGFFTQVKSLQELGRMYFIPEAPHVFLLGAEPQYRRFLSAVLDYAGKNGKLPKARTKPEVGGYSCSSLWLGNLSEGLRSLDMELLEAGMAYGESEIIPYSNALNKLADKIEKVAENEPR